MFGKQNIRITQMVIFHQNYILDGSGIKQNWSSTIVMEITKANLKLILILFQL